MKQSAKIGITFTGLGLAMGVGFLFFGIFGPFYRTEVTRIPINLQIKSQIEADFTVDRTEEYLIEVHLDRVFREAQMDEILGDWVTGGGGKIDISWQVRTSGTVVAQGSKAKFGYSPIFGESRSGLVIGDFNAERGQKYHLSVNTHNERNDWNRASPYISIGLHPSKLESYLVARIFGVFLSVVFGFLFLVLLFIFRQSIKPKAPNQSVQSDQPSAGR